MAPLQNFLQILINFVVQLITLFINFWIAVLQLLLNFVHTIAGLVH